MNWKSSLSSSPKHLTSSPSLSASLESSTAAIQTPFLSSETLADTPLGFPLFSAFFPHCPWPSFCWNIQGRLNRWPRVRPKFEFFLMVYKYVHIFYPCQNCEVPTCLWLARGKLILEPPTWTAFGNHVAKSGIAFQIQL